MLNRIGLPAITYGVEFVQAALLMFWPSLGASDDASAELLPTTTEPTDISNINDISVMKKKKTRGKEEIRSWTASRTQR